METTKTETDFLDKLGDYQFGFKDPDTFVFKSRRGLDEEVVRQISAMKGEPQWMLDFRLKALEHFQKTANANLGRGSFASLDLDNIFYYVKPTEAEGKTWDDVPDTIKKTFDKLGIPEAEHKFLAGAGRAV